MSKSNGFELSGTRYFCSIRACLVFVVWITECDISSRDFSILRLFSFFWEYQYRSLKNWSLKKSQYRPQKYLVSKKVSVSVSKILVSKKSLGIGLENFGLKKSQYWSQNIWSKKSLDIGLKKFGLKKVILWKYFVS